MSDLFGPLLSPYNVEQAIVQTYTLWIAEYLAEVERQNDLPNKTLPRPPDTESVHGGLDFENWTADHLPNVIVICNPAGLPERNASSGYTQDYEVQVGCVVEGESEEEARMIAGLYGAASMLLAQQCGIDLPASTRIVMEGSPTVEFIDPTKRRLARSVAIFHVFVDAIVFENDGPVGPTPQESLEYPGAPEEPYNEDPTVEKTDTTVTAEPI